MKSLWSVRKIYELLVDPRAEEHNMVRVVDEEGEDYLYPRDWFLPIELPERISKPSSGFAHS